MQPLSSAFGNTINTIRTRLRQESPSLGEELGQPKVGIVCGSGLSGLADALQEKVVIPYSELEGFAINTGERETPSITSSRLSDCM